MEGAYLKLVKDIHETFQNSDSICASLLGILRSARLQKIIVNQKDRWGLINPLCMKCATKLIHRGKNYKVPHQISHTD